MSRKFRKRACGVRVEPLETRALLTGLNVPGNVGEILVSQFGAQPIGAHGIAAVQFWGFAPGGPVNIHVNAGPRPTTAARAEPINSGRIVHSQFNGTGFPTVGLQFRNVQLRRGFTVAGFDTTKPAGNSAPATPTAATGPAFANRGLVAHSQFNDGGFGVLGTEGRVGMQWRHVRVNGPVGFGLEDLIIQPAKTPASATAAGDNTGGAFLHPSNTGRIRSSQYNDGGFGDIGFQWSKVDVRDRVATSTNTLHIIPQRNDNGPITAQDLTFGQSLTTSAGDDALPNSAAPATSTVPLANQDAEPVKITYDATNSGRILHSQFSDGGFGDVGLQWRKVRVGGSVTAVHNSLTVQPQNHGQGLITVRNVRFPSDPAVSAPPTPGSRRVLPPAPPLVRRDGASLAGKLPKPTRPFERDYIEQAKTSDADVIVDAATNSGLVQGSQFSAGGFGDSGLQWSKVQVRGGVSLIHNSLSVQPQGSRLQGINVNHVNFGGPITPGIAGQLAVLKSKVLDPTPADDLTAASASAGGGDFVIGPDNENLVRNQQLVNPSGADVYLQWNQVVRRQGLVIVHNVIHVHDIAPGTGPVTLTNIRFPYQVPPLTRPDVHPHPIQLAAMRRGDTVVRDTANNSGIISHAQFSDGGFGDVGLQWRNVKIGGAVAVVHNSLSLDLSADAPEGDVPGPINISDVTFNSGALEPTPGSRRDQLIITPPPFASRLSATPRNHGTPLPRKGNALFAGTNRGIIHGGQFASGGVGQVFLQWQGVRVPGKVTIINNVLSIGAGNKVTGPIHISDVTFA